MQKVTAEDVQASTRGKIEWLLTNAAWNPGILAELRRGAGKAPGDNARLFGYFLEGMPETFYGYRNNPSYAEWAIYIALTTLAVHQQGNDVVKKPMHKDGVSIGKAAATLAMIKGKSDPQVDRIRKRFFKLMSASTVEDLSVGLRTLVRLFKDANPAIEVDYALLARDIYFFQIPSCVSNLRLKWGEDFYASLNSNKTK